MNNSTRPKNEWKSSFERKILLRPGLSQARFHLLGSLLDHVENACMQRKPGYPHRRKTRFSIQICFGSQEKWGWVPPPAAFLSKHSTCKKMRREMKLFSSGWSKKLALRLASSHPFMISFRPPISRYFFGSVLLEIVALLSLFPRQYTRRKTNETVPNVLKAKWFGMSNGSRNFQLECCTTSSIPRWIEFAPQHSGPLLSATQKYVGVRHWVIQEVECPFRDIG